MEDSMRTRFIRGYLSSWRILVYLLFGNGIVSIVEGVVFERPVEPSAVIGSHWQTLLQSVDQIRVGNEVSTVEKGIILARLNNAP